MKMCAQAQMLIDNLCTERRGRLSIRRRFKVTLVSGGCAGADHVAVILAPQYKAIEIHFPCLWDGKHADHGTSLSDRFSWQTNPGRLANVLHEKFTKTVGWDTQADFKNLTNASFTYGKGFHDRNTKIAQVDYLIAFTFGEVSGGTLDTWKKSKAHRIHVDLNSIA